MILMGGMSPQDWDELETGVVNEVTHGASTLQMASRLSTVWARKKAIPTPPDMM